MKLHLDFETRSAVDLKKVGAWAYAMHPSTNITCFTFGADRSRLLTFSGRDLGWDWTKCYLPGLEKDHITAHNAPFEYAIYECILHQRFGWPARHDPKLWSCTLARAAMVGLPLDLATLGQVLEIKTPKDLQGRAAMQRTCKPIGYDALTGEPLFDETPEVFKTLCSYNRTDVLAEIEVDEKLPELPPHERAIWEHDLVINTRGVAVDLELAAKAAALADVLTTDLNARLKVLTGGRIDKATRVAAMQDYLASHGAVSAQLDKEAVTDLLADPMLPPKAREVLEIRRQVGKSSTAKYEKTLEYACPDGRARGALQYHAAHTGRWGGRGIQPQNYPKGFGEEEQARVVADILHANETQPVNYTGIAFGQKYGLKAMDALSDTLRGTIIAAPDHVLIAADFNAIEARVLFWEAGDESALSTYRRGDSPYVDMARYIYSDETITKKTHPKEYDLGKRTILGCGYGMGAPKFQKTVKTQANLVISTELAERAVRGYRDKYSSVKNMWYETERAAVAAVKTPGSMHPCMGGKVVWGITRDRQYLVARLPSGRWLWYYHPQTRVVEHPKFGPKEELCYWGEDPKTRQWCLLKTYGGALVENITQAIARDLMAEAMQQVESAGFPVVLTVHDELVCEIEATPFRLLDAQKTVLIDRFVKLMCHVPPWAAGLPVAAEGWVGKRYRK